MDFPESRGRPTQQRHEADGAHPVTHALGVTLDLTSRDVNPTSIIDKKQLCDRLGWSRPRLDRRLQSDPSFPVLHCGSRTDPWRFEVGAVLAYLAAAGNMAAGRRSHAPGNDTGVRDVVWAELRRELTEMRALRQVVEALLVQLGAGAGGDGIVAGERHGER